MITNKDNNRKRITPQREAILKCLKEEDSHLTAKEIHSQVKKKLSRISLGTVYRNLKELIEEGKIQKLTGEEIRYDWNCSPHGHFICEECGKVYDVALDYESLAEGVEEGKVKTCQVYFYGVCKDCENKGQ